MKHTPIQIDPELAAKYEGQEGQFDAFNKAFKKVIATDPASVPPVTEAEEKRPRGRPRKAS